MRLASGVLGISFLQFLFFLSAMIWVQLYVGRQFPYNKLLYGLALGVLYLLNVWIVSNNKKQYEFLQKEFDLLPRPKRFLRLLLFVGIILADGYLFLESSWSLQDAS